MASITPKAHVTFSQAEQNLFHLPSRGGDFTSQQLKSFLGIITSSPVSQVMLQLKTKISKIVGILDLGAEQTKELFLKKQSTLSQLRSDRARDVEEDLMIVATTQDEGTKCLQALSKNLLDEYDTKIEECVDEITLLETNLNAFQSTDHIDDIRKRIKSAKTTQEFAWAYQDLHIAAQSVQKGTKLAENVSEAFDQLIKQAIQVLNAEAKRIGDCLNEWRKQKEFDADKTKELFLDIVKLQVTSDFAHTLKDHTNKEEKRTIKRAVQDVLAIRKEFDEILTSKLKPQVESSKDKKPQNATVKFYVQGAEVAALSEKEIQLTVVNKGDKSPVEEAIRAMQSRLVSFARISQIASLKEGISREIVSAMKTSWVSAPLMHGVTALASQIACIYLTSGSKEEFLLHTGMFAINTFLTPIAVHWTAKKTGVEQYEYLLTPIAQVALPTGIQLAHKHFTLVSIVSIPEEVKSLPPLPKVTLPHTPLSIEPLTTSFANVTYASQAPSPLESMPSLPPLTISPPPVTQEVIAPSYAGTAEPISPPSLNPLQQELIAPPPLTQDPLTKPFTLHAAQPIAAKIEVQPSESWTSTAWKAVKSFSDFAINWSPYMQASPEYRPMATAVSTAVLGVATAGTAGPLAATAGAIVANTGGGTS